MNDEPRGELAIRTVAMPADTNPSGDIFGGWLLAQMDLAAGTIGYQFSSGRVATVAVDGMTFHRPVYVGDVVCCYAEVVHVGRTSMGVKGETHVRRGRTGDRIKVTEGTFSMVALDADGRPRPVRRSADTPG
ncbi:MAG: acyl-CoA thioesterase [Geminicoccaceae bacterium]